MYDELIKRLKNCATQAAPCNTCDITEDCSCADTLMKQAADAIEELTDRNVGKWMHKEITADFHVVGQCSICKERRRIDNFCPNCGAKMKSEGE